jgi:DNA-binding XRE family transcriptional regulator
MTFTKWSDVRGRHIAAIGAEEVERGKQRTLARVRAYRLVEVRKRLGITQRDVARTMGVSVGRVSQIENGEISSFDVLDRYIAALGGQLELIANFGEEQLKVG